MDTGTRSELLSLLGAIVVATRHQAISGSLNTIAGKYRDRVSSAISEQMEQLSQKQRGAVGELVLEAIDSTLSNFLEALVENEALDLTVSKDGKTHSIYDLSDDIGADYYGFVEEHSRLLPVTRELSDIIFPPRC